MPKINSSASDKEQNTPDTTVNTTNVTMSTDPVVITAVQRKANIGNYETIDIYMSVAIPQPGLDVTDKEALREALEQAADFGFGVVSRETGVRYKAVKEAAKDKPKA